MECDVVLMLKPQHDAETITITLTFTQLIGFAPQCRYVVMREHACTELHILDAR